MACLNQFKNNRLQVISSGAFFPARLHDGLPINKGEANNLPVNDIMRVGFDLAGQAAAGYIMLLAHKEKESGYNIRSWPVAKIQSELIRCDVFVMCSCINLILSCMMSCHYWL